MMSHIKRAWARWIPLLGFRGSQDYWRMRYRKGGDSGSGSAGEAAAYKASVLNQFVRDQNIETVVEFGCGDGRQLRLAEYPRYLGLDISPEAVAVCRRKYGENPSRRFALVHEALEARAELALSLDVTFHLVEDEVYSRHLDQLFGAAQRFVLIYSTDAELRRGTLPHVRHRLVSADVSARFPEFTRMVEEEEGLPPPVEFSLGLPSRFLFYRKRAQS